MRHSPPTTTSRSSPGRVRDRDELPAEEMLDGVRVLRIRSTAYDRAQLHLRAVNYGTYLADSLFRALTLKRPDIVLTLTDPPMIGDIGLLVARRFRVPLVVVSEDVFPEIAVKRQATRESGSGAVAACDG